MSSLTALVKRRDEAVALMPPPPAKRTKRPSTVLEEDDYTNALSDIIARDYFPGVAEAKAQEEYLSALESKNHSWINEAGEKLREAMTLQPGAKPARKSRDTRFDAQRSWTERTPVADTPRGDRDIGSDTPVTIVDPEDNKDVETKPQVDTSTLSLTSFQSKYTSEDNESFNTVLDKQNNTKRKKYAYLWTADQKIPSTHLLTHRATQNKLLEEKSHHEALVAKHNETALVPLSTGATSSRPASVQSWRQKTPNNTLMFMPDNDISETGLQTIQEAKEAASKAGPKETVFANTRFPPTFLLNNKNDDEGVNNQTTIPPSPSLNTTIIATRDARRAAKPHSTAPTDIDIETEYGGTTPRINGYAFVDEDEPENITSPKTIEQPSYRDILAGQVGDSTPNPFRISEVRRREDLHLRLVAKEQVRRREKEKETELEEPGDRGGASGNMTPAARKLMERLGRTPVHRRDVSDERVGGGIGKEMWTPGATPRRKR